MERAGLVEKTPDDVSEAPDEDKNESARMSAGGGHAVGSGRGANPEDCDTTPNDKSVRAIGEGIWAEEKSGCWRRRRVNILNSSLLPMSRTSSAMRALWFLRVDASASSLSLQVFE